MDRLIDELGLKRWIREGSMDVKSFERFLRIYLADSTRMYHPGYLAHQVATPDHPAALADFVHGVINNPMAIYEMGPSAAAVERVVVDWMLDKVGWLEDDGRKGCGVLTHGGSLANLTALLAARAASSPSAWDRGMDGDLAILAPSSTHYSIRRVASIIGIGGDNVYPIDVDMREVVIADRLPAALERARDEGKRVVAVAANACATSTGLHDPLEEMGSFAREEGLWLHVDGAHGASALLSDRERQLLRGVELADSLSWDAHKMMRTSALCTAVLFRDPRSLDRAFQQDASYIFYGEEGPGVDFIRHTIECTKSSLGLKIFLNLAWRGEKGVAGYIEKQYDLTRRLYDRIRKRRGFECPYVPEANILCFRFEGSNDFQVALRERLLEEGRFYITSTEIHGKRHLRLTVMSPETTEATVEELLDSIERIAGELEKSERKRI
jgi:L-2,4-diaminobutyrate decarboxylase